MTPFDSGLCGVLYDDLSELAHGSYPALLKFDELTLEALVFLCSAYLIQSQMAIDEVSSPYFRYSQDELFKKWTTMNIYIESRKPNAVLYVGGGIMF